MGSTSEWTAPAQQRLDEDEAKAQMLFSACLRRDRWVDALEGSGSWHAERAAALMRSGKPGGREILHIHRSSGVGDSALSCFAATVISSLHAPIGEVVWQIDRREKTLTAFGEPGFGGLLFGTQSCVMLVEQTGAFTCLYFYIGKVCQLRCWRRDRSASGSSSDSNSDSDGSQIGSCSKSREERNLDHGEGDERPQKQPQRQPQLQPHRQRKQHGSHQRRYEDDREPKNSRDERKARRTHAKDKPTSCRHAASGELPGVAAWARGKDVASLLAELPSLFSHALPGANLPKVSSAESLRGASGREQLRKAYRKALLAVHPDKHVASPPECLALATALFQALSAAHAAEVAKDGDQGGCGC